MTAIAMPFVKPKVTRVVIAAIGVVSAGATHKMPTGSLMEWNLDKC